MVGYNIRLSSSMFVYFSRYLLWNLTFRLSTSFELILEVTFLTISEIFITFLLLQANKVMFSLTPEIIHQVYTFALTATINLILYNICTR